MAKVELAVGQLSFSADGAEEWVAKQFGVALAKFAELASIASKISSQPEGDNGGGGSGEEDGPLGSLASHIKERGGDKSQTRRFLATADWLRRKGEKGLKTAKVSAALKENQQKRLANPSQSLNDNVSQGFCEKDSQGFFITQEGLKELGYKA